MSDTAGETTPVKDKMWWIVGVVLTIIMGIWYTLMPLPIELAEIVELLMFVGIASAVTISFVLVAKHFDFFSTKVGISMTLIAIAFALWTGAETLWLVYFLNSIDPFPSIADAFWIIGYIGFIVAILTNARSIRVKFSREMLGLWILLSVAITLVVLAFDVVPLLEGGLDFEILITILYPIEDIAVIIPALVILLKYRSGEVAKPWAVLILGFISTAIGDILYAFAENAELYYSPYHPVDFFLMLGYVACFTSALLFISLYRKQLVK